MYDVFLGAVLKNVLPTLKFFFAYPEKILLASFWDNPVFKRNRRVVTCRMYPEIANTVNKLADFFNPNSCELLTLEEFNAKYNVILSFEKFPIFTNKYCNNGY